MLNEIIYSLIIVISLFGGILAFVLYANTRMQEILNETDKMYKTFNDKEKISIKEKKIYNIIKRVFDLVIAGIALITLFPVFLILGVFIKIETKESLFYKVKMIGKNGKHFTAIKFRTMHSLEPTNNLPNLHHNDSRLLRIGRFLRMSFIDELPMLVSVFNGDLSLVGISLKRVNEEDLISGKTQSIILKSKPGLASLWSISRSNYFEPKTIQEKYNLDIYYSTRRGLMFDALILTRALLLLIGNVASY